MAITYYDKTRQFHLFNDEISYLMRIMENGQLEHLYFGKALRDRDDFSYLHEEMLRPLMSISSPEPSELSMHYTMQEYPSYGTGDYRAPAFTVLQENGSRVVDYTYVSHVIYRGKKDILPIPSTYVEEEEEAWTLEITLHDALTDTDIILSYTIYDEYPVITRNVRFEHHGAELIVLERALSVSVEFPDMDYEMMHLSGAWGRERYIKNRKLEMGLQAVQSLAGTASSSEHNPFIALKRPYTTEEQGEVYGFSFVYSGNFLAQAEVSTFDMTRVTMGIHPENFSWELRKGDVFQTPEVVMVYSDRGLGKMSRVYHRLYRTRLMHGEWRDRARPILLNNWEATNFDFDEARILKIAEKAKDVGVELFVLDDGWFGSRNDEYHGLGDWYANRSKLPEGIQGLSAKIEGMGLKFGLWMELEMVNKDSQLYQEHPDWVIGAPGRFESHARHQYVLDFSRKDVVDYIYKAISELIRNASISYIKWDMNRYMTEPYSRGGADPAFQGKMMHQYILGVYDLYMRLTREFPQILFESCASGGARFDPALLYFAPQVWTSDDTDAMERLKIQYGTSMVYPVVSMGTHVSAVPNQQLQRTTSLDTRANVAYFGTFGYEMDLNLLQEEEMELVKKQILFMKEYRELIQIEGDFYRLVSPFEKNETAWMAVSRDGAKAVVVFCQRLNKVNGSMLRLKLQGLCPDSLYEVSCDAGEESRCVRSGGELMYAGIPVDRGYLCQKGGDFASLLYTIRKVAE